jgi:hypothetical protein
MTGICLRELSSSCAEVLLLADLFLKNFCLKQNMQQMQQYEEAQNLREKGREDGQSEIVVL